MSMSYDFVKLEKLSQFVDFINAISKPDELKANVEAMQQAGAELKELLGAKQTVEKAEAFMAECRVEMQKGFDDLEKKEKELADRVQRSNDLLSEKEAKLEEQRVSQQEVAKSLDATSTRVKSEVEDLEYRYQKNALWEKSLRDLEEFLSAKEVDLAEKAEKIKSIIG